jgi:RNA polymerase sigma-70 factor (ECF subfamily)
MTRLSPAELALTGSAHPGAEPEDWVAMLSADGPAREDALRRLHGLMLRAARFQVSRMRRLTAVIGAERVDEIVNESADEAMVALLAKLPTFEGRSRFTTWAYKFAVLQAAVAIRRQAWQDREISLDSSAEFRDRSASPEQYAEASDLSRAVTAAIGEVLTPHQRRIVFALLVDEVPIDVLAERLGTSRNALYKTVHDARRLLRAHLTATGYLAGTTDAGMAP